MRSFDARVRRHLPHHAQHGNLRELQLHFLVRTAARRARLVQRLNLLHAVRQPHGVAALRVALAGDEVATSVLLLPHRHPAGPTLRALEELSDRRQLHLRRRLRFLSEPLAERAVQCQRLPRDDPIAFLVLLDLLRQHIARVLPALADRLEVLLEAGAEPRLRQFQVHQLVAFDESHAECAGHQVALIHLADVLALLDLRDVLGVRRIGADSVLLHHRDQIRFGEHRRRVGGAFVEAKFRRREGRAGLVVVDLLARPPVVRIHVEVVPLEDHQTRRCELLLTHRRVYDGLRSDGVAANTSKEVPHHQLVHALLIALQGRDELRRMDRRMRLVRLVAVAWVRSPLKHARGELSPLGMRHLHLHQRSKVNVRRELVRLRARVADEALRVQLLGDGHDGLGGEFQLARARLLQLDGVHRLRAPLRLRLLLDVGDVCFPNRLAHHQQRLAAGLLEESVPRPVELDGQLVDLVRDWKWKNLNF